MQNKNEQAITQPKQGRGRLFFLIVLGQILALLFVAGLARLFFYDRSLMLIWLNLFAFYLYLPAYVILIIALFMREKALAITAVGIILFHLLLIIPPFVPRANFDEASPAGEVVRLFNANLMFTNEETEAMIAEIQQADADVLIFQEYTPAWDAAFMDSWMDAVYPYRILNIIDSPFGSGIWSKRPLTDTEIWNTEGIEMVHATIEIDGQPVRLHNVHPPPPMGNFDRLDRIHDEIQQSIAAEPIPVIAIGDFNLGQHNRQYKNLLNQGLYSLHQELGRGMAMTWPNGMKSVPPVRLDHALITFELIGLSITKGIGSGSDHRPFVINVALTD